MSKGKAGYHIYKTKKKKKRKEKKPYLTPIQAINGLNFQQSIMFAMFQLTDCTPHDKWFPAQTTRYAIYINIQKHMCTKTLRCTQEHTEVENVDNAELCTKWKSN